MFGIGTTELFVILVVALLVFGPNKLPELMRSLGKGLAEFKRMSTDVKRTLDAELEKAEMDQKKSEKKQIVPEKPDTILMGMVKNVITPESTEAEVVTQSGTSTPEDKA